MYGYERGTLRFDTDRPLYWEGMVGFMYPSDYGYAAGNICVTSTKLDKYGECKNKDWLWMTNTIYYTNREEWLMSLCSGYSLAASGVSVYGFVGDGSDVRSSYSVRPTFYLTSSTLITGGTGTESDPYIISK